MDRRKEVSDAILPMVVDGNLDADGGIDDPKERRRQPAPRHAPPPAGAREAHRVGDDAAAHSEHRLGAPERVDPLELVEEECEGLHRLLVFIPRRNDRLELQILRESPLAHLISINLPDGLIDHHDQPSGAQLWF